MVITGDVVMIQARQGLDLPGDSVQLLLFQEVTQMGGREHNLLDCVLRAI